MYGYRRGAIVLQKPPSPLAYLLSGLGMGVTQGVERVLKEREERKDRAGRILEGFLSGKFPVGMAGTDVFQKYAERGNLLNEPGIQELIWSGREEFRPEPQTKLLPGGQAVTVPQPAPENVPYEQARKVYAEAESAQKLREFRAKEIIKKQVEKAFRLPLGERLEMAMKVFEWGLKRDAPIGDIDVRDPDTGISVDFTTHLDQLKKQQLDELAKNKTGIDYLKGEQKYYDMLMSADKMLKNVREGKDISIKFGDLGIYIHGTEDKEISKLSPQAQARRYIPLLNKRLNNQHNILRKQKKIARDKNIVLPFRKQFTMDEFLNPDKYVGEFELIQRFNDFISGKVKSKEWEHKPTEPVKESDLRKVVVSQKPDAGETKEKIDYWKNQIVQWIDAETNQMYTEEKALEVAKEYLGIE